MTEQSKTYYLPDLQTGLRHRVSREVYEQYLKWFHFLIPIVISEEEMTATIKTATHVH